MPEDPRARIRRLREAGRKGGLVRGQRYRETSLLSRWAARGGRVKLFRKGLEHLAEMGKKGGEANIRNNGRGQMKRIRDMQNGRKETT